MDRRVALGLASCGVIGLVVPAQGLADTTRNRSSGFAPVLPGRKLTFPRDHGAHPDFRTEWWYLTGWCESTHGLLGVQITFFRSRTRVAPSHPSFLAPRQLMLGHFALADPRRGQLLHAEQAWRVTPGVADYSTEDCQLQMGAWSMRRHGSGRQERIATRASAPKFTADLELAPTSDPWLQGSSGFSAKGASGQEASYYYSRPQLTLTGSIAIEGKSAPVKGQAWFDHEWSSTLLNPDAKGWDWVGINLFDGQSLMAFRIHGAQGKTLFRTANTLRGSDDVQWEVLNTWRSPRTAATYPVSQRLRSEQLGELTLIPIMADQELDARQGTGLVYWEGLVAVMQGSRLVGRGYLEMTGYAGQITF